MKNFFKNKRGIGGLTLIALVVLGCFALVGLNMYTSKAPSGTVIVQPGQVPGQDTYFPVAWNAVVYENNTKVAATVYAFDSKVQYPDVAIAGGDYIASCSYLGAGSVELVTKATLDAYQAMGRYDGVDFWIYAKPSGYQEGWKQILVQKNKYSTTEDQEIGVVITKAGSITESGSTSLITETSSTAAWETNIISTYTKPVVVRFVDSNASSSEISTITFKIDDVAQSVSKVSGGWYTVVTLAGNRELEVTATRKTAADLNASVATYINELSTTATSDFYNYGTLLFPETNTD